MEESVRGVRQGHTSKLVGRYRVHNALQENIQPLKPLPPSCCAGIVPMESTQTGQQQLQCPPAMTVLRTQSPKPEAHSQQIVFAMSGTLERMEVSAKRVIRENSRT